MRLRHIFAFALIVCFSGCGHWQKLTSDYSPITKPIDPGQSVNINDIYGDWDVDLIEIDSDPVESSDFYVTITSTLRNIEFINADERQVTMGARLKSSTVEFDEDGTYSLEYEIVNSSNADITVGRFSKGIQRGEYELFGNVILFHPADEGDLGFAEEETASYIITIADGALTAITNAPSLTGNYLTKLTAVR